MSSSLQNVRQASDLGVAQHGSALPWGGRGRKFKSCHSDQLNEQRKLLVFLCFIKLLGHFEATFKMPCFYALLRSFLRGVTQFVTQKCGTQFSHYRIFSLFSQKSRRRS